MFQTTNQPLDIHTVLNRILVSYHQKHRVSSIPINRVSFYELIQTHVLRKNQKKYYQVRYPHAIPIFSHKTMDRISRIGNSKKELSIHFP